MTIAEKYKKIEDIAGQYLEGFIVADEAVNAIVLITHNTVTTEEFHQR